MIRSEISPNQPGRWKYRRIIFVAALLSSGLVWWLLLAIGLMEANGLYTIPVPRISTAPLQQNLVIGVLKSQSPLFLQRLCDIGAHFLGYIWLYIDIIIYYYYFRCCDTLGPINDIDFSIKRFYHQWGTWELRSYLRLVYLAILHSRYG